MTDMHDDDNEHVLLSKVARLTGGGVGSFVAQVNGVMFYDLSVSGAGWGDCVYLVRAPYNPYDCNCLDVRCARGRPYTSLLSALICMLHAVGP